jgi:hypothetical protein
VIEVLACHFGKIAEEGRFGFKIGVVIESSLIGNGFVIKVMMVGS